MWSVGHTEHVLSMRTLIDSLSCRHEKNPLGLYIKHSFHIRLVTGEWIWQERRRNDVGDQRKPITKDITGNESRHMSAVRCSSFKAPVVQHFHFFTCKNGVKWPHPGTRLMDILGLWSLAVMWEEQKMPFFIWKCSRKIQDLQTRSNSLRTRTDLPLTPWYLTNNPLLLSLVKVRKGYCVAWIVY